MNYKLFFLSLLLIPSFTGIVYGHTVDGVGDYRIEIGWMNEPVVSGETNALELLCESTYCLSRYPYSLRMCFDF